MNEKIEARIIQIEQLLMQNLRIPEYQRPYRWTVENVRQLLQDVYESWKSGKKTFRIGSVILHTNNDGKLNVVDGQQRITTIVLTLKNLSRKNYHLAQELRYNHVDSKNAIIVNYEYINRWLKENLSAERELFEKYLLESCEIVEIKVKDLSEAFQMFDSQNGRGKELEAYNLLKAYHIRAMEHDTFNEKIKCDQNWESATRYTKNDSINISGIDILGQLFNEQLYRTRVWSRKEVAGKFDKKKIGEFKGVTINKHSPITYPFHNRELLYYFLEDFLKNEKLEITILKQRFNSGNSEKINPFVLINENIINGKHFFDYTSTYVEIYRQLFLADKSEQLIDFKMFYETYCLGYHGSHRDGDRYLRELYKALVFMVFDKFGEDGLNKLYKTLYALVYRLRLEKLQVKYNAVDEYPTKNAVFHLIENAKSYSDLQLLEQLACAPVECKKEVSNILNLFSKLGIKVNTNDSNIDLAKYDIKWKKQD